jgi:hypothetical protein
MKMGTRLAVVALAIGAGLVVQACAQTTYAKAPIDQYRVANRTAEIALARTGAPASISGDAEIMVLGARGYEVAVKGSNGFTCIVDRSWSSELGHAEFWNQKIRSPTCFNAVAARSVLPLFLKRTELVLAGLSREEIETRTKAAVAAGEIKPPEAGAMCYMMSKSAYLSDEAGGHWRPHVMFYVPRVEAAAWGANMAGSPVYGGANGIEPMSVFIVPADTWSDGTPAAPGHS